MVVSVLDTLTSVIAGCVVFSVLGTMALDLGVTVPEVVSAGPGLAFVAYPEALSRLPLPQLWSALFFFMIFLLGVDSEFATVECIIGALADEITVVNKHKTKFTILIGIVFFLLGLPMVTHGGPYVFEIINEHGSAKPFLITAIFEVFGIMWVYGFDQFAFDINYMLNRKMGWYWKLTWKYTAPFLLAFIAIYSFVNNKPLSYGDNYVFPVWAQALGWSITIFFIGQIPLWAIVTVMRQQKVSDVLEKVNESAKPLDSWGPRNPTTREHWLEQRRAAFDSIQVIQMTSLGVTHDGHRISAPTMPNIAKY